VDHSRRGSEEILLSTQGNTPTLLALPKLLGGLLLYVFSGFYGSASSTTSRVVGLLLGTTEQNDSFATQDDLISTSGDGSQMADEEDSDKEDLLNIGHSSAALSSHMLGQAKKKSRCSRARTNTVKTDSSAVSEHSAFATALTTPQNTCSSVLTQQQSVSSPSLTSSANGYASSSLATNSLNGPTANSASNNKSTANGHVTSTTMPNGVAERIMPMCNGNGTATNNNNIVRDYSNLSEFKQLYKEKEALEQMVEKFKQDIKQIRNNETELRSELSLAQQLERSSRHELTQVKTKCDQLETKMKQFVKQNDQSKSSISTLEKRVSDLQHKKTELERDLAAEKNAARQAREEYSKPTGSDSDNFKLKINSLEREIKTLKRDIRSKDDAASKMDEELKRLKNRSQRNDEESFQKQIQSLKERNTRLEQTLSSENRLKQDLFRALNASKAQIESLSNRLSHYEQGVNNVNDFAGGDARKVNLNGDFSMNQQHSPGSTPTSMFGSIMSSMTPPPTSMSSQIDLDQLMQATGAQYMSYSFGGNNSMGGEHMLFDGPNSRSNSPATNAVGGLGLSDLVVGSQRSSMASSLSSIVTGQTSRGPSN
jgi:predicted  nucleic acid-binding Zn-ribbon protein